MAIKLQEASFSFMVKKGNFGREIAEDLITNEEFIGFCKQFEGSRIRFWMKEQNDKQTKENMFEYYHRVVLSVAIQCFSDQGWTAVDKVKADYMLKAECAKIEEYNPKTGELIIFLEDKASMPFSRLHKYISDCIDWLQEQGYRTPDSYEFKNPGFKKV